MIKRTEGRKPFKCRSLLASSPKKAELWASKTVTIVNSLEDYGS
jgi:hypothetical protein